MGKENKTKKITKSKGKYIVFALIVILATTKIMMNNNSTQEISTETASEKISIIEEPTVARIDIQTKLINADEPQFEVYVDDSNIPEKQAGWMPKYGSQGYVVQKEGYNMIINIKSYIDGNIRFTLRGRERRPNGDEAIPVWVTYTSLKINGKEILTNPVTVWLSKGYEYNIEANIGEEYKIYTEWKEPDKIPEE